MVGSLGAPSGYRAGDTKAAMGGGIHKPLKSWALGGSSRECRAGRQEPVGGWPPTLLSPRSPMSGEVRVAADGRGSRPMELGCH